LHPRLRQLLEKGEFDWDDRRHRAAFLEYWIRQPQAREEEPVESR